MGASIFCANKALAVETIAGSLTDQVNLDNVSYSPEKTFIFDGSVTTATHAVTGNSSGFNITVNAGKTLNGTGGSGIHLSAWGGNQTIVNYGAIIGNGAGAGGTNGGIVVSHGAATITNHVGALIQNDKTDGIYTNNSGSNVTNNGTIQTGVTGVYFGDGGIFNQGVTGVVQSGASNALYGVIGNSGTLTGNNAGTINIVTTGINDGVGVLYRNSALGDFTNSGHIYGSNAGVRLNSTGAVILTNTGTIATDAGKYSIDIQSSNNTVTLGTGSTLIGDAVVSGSRTNNHLILQGSSTEDNNLTNFDSLTMNGSAWNLSGTTTIKGTGAAATTVNNGVLEISGTLNNTIGGSTINNNGTLVVSGLLSNAGASGTTINSGGTLQIGNGGSTGDVVGQSIITVL